MSKRKKLQVRFRFENVTKPNPGPRYGYKITPTSEGDHIERVEVEPAKDDGDVTMSLDEAMVHGRAQLLSQYQAMAASDDARLRATGKRLLEEFIRASASRETADFVRAMSLSRKRADAKRARRNAGDSTKKKIRAAFIRRKNRRESATPADIASELGMNPRYIGQLMKAMKLK